MKIRNQENHGSNGVFIRNRVKEEESDAARSTASGFFILAAMGWRQFVALDEALAKRAVRSD